jgi:hypothetical protein
MCAVMALIHFPEEWSSVIHITKQPEELLRVLKEINYKQIPKLYLKAIRHYTIK